jgi:hypothetical protein
LLNDGEVKSRSSVTGLSLTTDASLSVEMNSALITNVGIAVVNPRSNATNLTMTLRGSDGLPAGNPLVLMLSAHQQFTKFVSEIFSGAGAAFTGILRIQSSSPVSILGLRFSGVVFNALPFATIAASPEATSGAFPQFAIGGGWASQLAFLNNTLGTVSGRFDVLDGSGNPMAVTLNGFNQSSYTYSIPAGGALIFAPRDVNGQTPM